MERIQLQFFFFYVVTLIWNALDPSGNKLMFAQWELPPKQQHFKRNLSGYFRIPPRISTNAFWLFRSRKLHIKLSDYCVSSQIQPEYYISRRLLLLYIFFLKHVKLCLVPTCSVVGDGNCVGFIVLIFTTQRDWSAEVGSLKITEIRTIADPNFPMSCMYNC
jgi:hypothetical protein